MTVRWWLAVALGFGVLVAAPVWLPAVMEVGRLSLDPSRVAGFAADLGPAGPLAVVGLLALAVVVSPIPSGPIALAAGALYGPVWGTVLVVAGAEAGAVIAFSAARYLGYDALRRSSHPVLVFVTKPRSQWSLMAVVFASRLVPFLSFDAVSYAAGLTCLAFWRFVLATLVGVIPVAVAFVAMGHGLVGAQAGWLPLVLLAGGVTLVPLAVHRLWLWQRRRRAGSGVQAQGVAGDLDAREAVEVGHAEQRGVERAGVDAGRQVGVEPLGEADRVKPHRRRGDGAVGGAGAADEV